MAYRLSRHVLSMCLPVLIILTFAFIVGCSGTPQLPKIDVSTALFDLGDVSPEAGKRVETFKIKNIGGAPLTITALSTSCGCTKAAVDIREILPGQQAQLTVTYDPSVHPDLVGSFKRVVYIQSNDPVQEEVELMLLGNALPRS